MSCMYGCSCVQTQLMYRLLRLSILSLFSSGFVCVRVGQFAMRRIIFFCILMSGFMYVFWGSVVPHSVMEYVKCGYANVLYWSIICSVVRYLFMLRNIWM